MKLDINFVIPLMGVAFIFFGLYIRLGNLKQVYWKSRRSMFGYIPLGLIFLLAGYYDLASSQGPYIFYAYIALFVILGGHTVFLTARPPAFIKPDWIQWVEKHPINIQKAMQADVQENPDWKKNVTSETAVDAWAKQVGRKLPKKK
jgi:hypothetical protein